METQVQQTPPRTSQAGPPERGRRGAYPGNHGQCADGKYLGVRVGVTNGGCAGMSYTMDYAEDAKPFEEVMEDKGVKVFIDPKAILFLIGTELDFVTRKAGRAICLQQSRTRLRRAVAAKASPSHLPQSVKRDSTSLR